MRPGPGSGPPERPRAMPRRPARSARRPPAGRTGPAAWLAAAREMLVADGVDQVRIDRIARRMGVTRGGFYWHFRDRQQLLDALLHDWEESCMIPFAAMAAAPLDLESGILRLFSFWLEASDFNLRFDAAVRDWARKSDPVRAAVRRADERRVAFIRGLFAGAGYGEPEALVRARVLYYTQVGYHTLEVEETLAARTALASLYYAVFTGRPLDPARIRLLPGPSPGPAFT
ncbi:MAG: helix-turn-helix domain-containing protein [Dongiaceae bacterium]